MHAIFEKCFVFSPDRAKPKSPITHLEAARPVANHQRLRINASRRPQNVPEWVRETDLYALAVKDGSIYEISHSAGTRRGRRSAKALSLASATNTLPAADKVPEIGGVQEQPDTDEDLGLSEESSEGDDSSDKPAPKKGRKKGTK